MARHVKSVSSDIYVKQGQSLFDGNTLYVDEECDLDTLALAVVEAYLPEPKRFTDLAWRMGAVREYDKVNLLAHVIEAGIAAMEKEIPPGTENVVALRGCWWWKS